MTWCDPKAPADSQRHPAAALAQQSAQHEQAERDQAARDAQRWGFLLGQGHMTSAEEGSDDTPDLEEMERRSALVADLNAGTTEEAVITDLTGLDHRWNTETESWEPVSPEPEEPDAEQSEPEAAKPARKTATRKARARTKAGPDEDPQKALDAALAKLDANKGKA